MPATSPTKEARFLNTLLCMPVFMAAAAFFFRLAFLFLVRHSHIALSTPYLNETTGIAASIASGRGFASPFPLAHTGTTAWLCPIYPYLVAGIFRLSGIFTPNSLLLVQILNCLFASLTVFPIYAVAKRTFGSTTAVAAAWLWVFLPFACWTPIQDIWDTSLTAFLFASILWATLAIRERSDFPSWLAYGFLWALAALVNAAVLSVLPFFFVWLLWQRRRFSFSLTLPSAALLVCILLLVPWTIRNHSVFGKWIPLRSNFGLELWLGNNPAAGDTNSFVLHPLWNASEAAEFERAGEINYLAAKQHDALIYMRAHPAQTAYSMAGRVWSNWFAVTDRVQAQWSTLPLYVRALFIANLSMVLLGGLALILALRQAASEALLYVIVVLVFPLPYYLTHTLVRYRFPIEPIITILAVQGLLQIWIWGTGRSLSDAREQVATLKPVR
jgi:4-amino-4-deoxy-L-arabinose transferase-like glycosyltransferase